MPVGTAGAIALGYAAVVKINSTAFGVKSGRVVWNVDEQEVGDTLNGSYKVYQGARQFLEISCEFYEKPLLNPLLTPLFLVPGTYVAIQVWPRGVTNVNNDVLLPYASDVFYVSRYSIQYDVDGKVQGSIEGKSSGAFVVPTNA